MPDQDVSNLAVPSLDLDPVENPMTIETMMDRVRAWSDLTPDRRRDLISDLRAVRRIHENVHASGAEKLGRQQAGGLCPPTYIEPIFLRRILFAHSPAAFGLSIGRFRNVLSSLRYTMREFGLLDEPSYGSTGVSEAWRKLLQGAMDFTPLGLNNFARYCSQNHVRPDGVTENDLTAFERRLATRTLSPDPCKQARTVMRAWNKAAVSAPGWPQRRLALPKRKEAYTLPLEDYPTSLQEDVAEFVRRCGASTDPNDVFSDDIFHEKVAGATTTHRKRAARPATVKTRVFQIQLALAALVRSGMDPNSLTSLRDLVQPTDRAKIILSFFYERSGKKPTSMTAGVGELLRQLAKFHCGAPNADVTRIASWVGRIAPPRQGTMTEKNKRRLQALSTSRNQAMLLHLPSQLMAQATAAQATTPILAARQAMRACAIELLLICPMRMKNLVLGLSLIQADAVEVALLRVIPYEMNVELQPADQPASTALVCGLDAYPASRRAPPPRM